MAMSEGDIAVSDTVTAQLVECAPEPAREPQALPDPPEGGSPVRRAQDATIAQTGADPPPEEP